MSVKIRQMVEKEIATAVIRSGIAAGYTFIIDNGGDEDEEIATTTEAETLAAMFATDEEHLYFIRDGKKVGWVFFVYGNDGWDVISDYTTNLELLLADANKVSEKYSD